MKFYIECETRKPAYKKRMRKILVKQVDNILQSKDCLVKLNVCVKVFLEWRLLEIKNQRCITEEKKEVDELEEVGPSKNLAIVMRKFLIQASDVSRDVYIFWFFFRQDITSRFHHCRLCVAVIQLSPFPAGLHDLSSILMNRLTFHPFQFIGTFLKFI